MRVSFDFDGVIALPKWDEEKEDWERDAKGNRTEYFNPKIGQKIKDHAVAGDEVIVVTSRLAIWREETEAFIADNNLMGYIDGVYFTNNSWKANTLKKMKVDLHYDDYMEELRRIKYKKIKVILVKDTYLDEDPDIPTKDLGTGWPKY